MGERKHPEETHADPGR